MKLVMNNREKQNLNRRPPADTAVQITQEHANHSLINKTEAIHQRQVFIGFPETSRCILKKNCIKLCIKIDTRQSKPFHHYGVDQLVSHCWVVNVIYAAAWTARCQSITAGNAYCVRSFTRSCRHSLATPEAVRIMDSEHRCKKAAT